MCRILCVCYGHTHPGMEASVRLCGGGKAAFFLHSYLPMNFRLDVKFLEEMLYAHRCLTIITMCPILLTPTCMHHSTAHNFWTWVSSEQVLWSITKTAGRNATKST